MVFWKKKMERREKQKQKSEKNSRFGWRKYFNSKKKSSTFHCLDPNCVRRCNNKSSGFYLFTKWIVEVLRENSVNVKSTSGVFLHNKRITDLSTSDCLVTLMHNLFVRVVGGRSVRGVHERRVSISEAMDLNYPFFIVFVRVAPPSPPLSCRFLFQKY